MNPFWPVFLAASIRPADSPPTWFVERISPVYVDEGDAVTYQLSGINLAVGMRCIIWITETIASANNWADSWETIFRDEVARKGGLDIVKLQLRAGTPQGVGVLDMMFTTNASYDPLTRYTFTNYTRRNRMDNQGTLPDNTKGRPFQLLLKAIPAAEGGVPAKDGFIKQKGGSYTNVRDTSRSPSGVPAINVRSLGANGGPAEGTVREGDSFRIEIVGFNVAANTVLRIYLANLGQRDVTPGLRDQLVAACNAAGCIGRVPSWTPETSGDWFNGGFVTFPKTYVSGTPIVLDFTATRDNISEPEKQIDVLASIYREGDVDDFGGVANPRGNWNADTVYNQKDWVFYLPTGRRFVYTAGLSTKGQVPPTDNGETYENKFWREYVPVLFNGASTSRTLVDIPARYWELRATSDGTTITYTIQGPHGSDSTVAFQSANPPPGFDSAMQNALTASGFMSLSGGRLSTTNPTQAEGAVTFTVPHAGSGKHTMRITDLQGTVNSWIIIGDACVFLTPPAALDTVRNLYGWNASGGEFNNLYTPSYTDKKPAAVWANVPAGGFMAYNGGRYYYPSKPEEPDPANQHQQLDYFYRNGARYMRFPFKLQRLQRQAFGPLYYGDNAPFGRFTNHDMRRVIEAAAYWLNLDPQNRVLFDAHDFGEYTWKVVQYDVATAETYSDRYRFDSAGAPPAILVDFWIRFVETMLVALPMGRWDLDFMNEPKEVNSPVAPAQWAATMQWLTNAVRARTNYLGICHREGTQYSSASAWTTNGNGAANVNSYDPARNMVFHVHSYNDRDTSGVSGACVSNAGMARLTSITQWARDNGFTRDNGAGLFLGETGAGDPAVPGQEVCGPLIRDQLQFLLDNNDVWLGYTWYASGFQVSYVFALDPNNQNFLAPTHTANLVLNSRIWRIGNGLPAIPPF